MDEIMNKASSGNRTHIGFFGRMNTGKSSLINAFVHQQVSIVSDQAGTTTDVVRKPMEIHGIGACVLLDTAGFDDVGILGKSRVAASEKALEMTDIAVVLFSESSDAAIEKQWVEKILKQGIPVIGVISKCDCYDSDTLSGKVQQIQKLNIPVVACSAENGTGLDELRIELIHAASSMQEKRTVLQEMVKQKSQIVLVMPQDPQAPEGRLIQPEVQTIRDALDRHCIVTCVQMEELSEALDAMKRSPDLIVTDSQCFSNVYALKPSDTQLTSFSILFAALKGDIQYYVKSAEEIGRLNENSKVLIAEVCTHAPMNEDIGRVKIPRMLRKRAGEHLQVDVCAGSDFPENLNQYDLIIQCGGCMFNRRHILSRIHRAMLAGVPMTNYGIAIAWMNGILDHVAIPAVQEKKDSE